MDATSSIDSVPTFLVWNFTRKVDLNFVLFSQLSADELILRCYDSFLMNRPLQALGLPSGTVMLAVHLAILASVVVDFLLNVFFTTFSESLIWSKVSSFSTKRGLNLAIFPYF